MTWENPPTYGQDIQTKKNAPAASLRGADRTPVSYITLHTVVRHLDFKLSATNLSTLSLAGIAPSTRTTVIGDGKRKSTDCIHLCIAGRIE